MERAYRSDLAMEYLTGFPVMTRTKKVYKISGGLLSPESNYAADWGHGIGLHSLLHSLMWRLKIIAD